MSHPSLVSVLSALTCPWCRELLEIPKVFPCGHFYCLECSEEVVNEKNGCCVCNMPFAIREAREDNPLRDLVALSIELDSVLQQINKEKELQTRLRKRTSGGTEEFKEDEAIKEGTTGGSNRTDNLSLDNDNTKNAGVFVTQPSITTTSSSSDGVGRRVSRVGRVIKDKNPE